MGLGCECCERFLLDYMHYYHSGIMGKKRQRIELYLDSQKIVINSENPYYNKHTGRAYTTMAHPRLDDLYAVKEGYFGLSEKEKVFIVQLDQLAKDSNKELKIYDIKNFWHSVRAYYKGIEETPVVIIGNKQFTPDDINLEQPIELSKETFESTMDPDRFKNGLLLMGIGGAFGLLALILLSSGFFCFSAMISIALIGVGALVSFGELLDRFYDWAH